MELTLTQNDKSYQVDLNSGVCLAIPYHYNGAQPNFYNVPKGTAEPFKQDDYVGRVTDHVGCNVMVVQQNIHCTGTHTECAGHISNEPISIHDILNHVYFIADLISVVPVQFFSTQEKYHLPIKDNEPVITREMVQGKISENSIGLVVRTMPNSRRKIEKKYNSLNTPFFTTEAIEYICETGIKHLVVDIPTIDRTDDGGRLGNHHIFFETEPPYEKTITEMAFIDNGVPDGRYCMTIEIPPMMLDAAPSRPFIFDIKEANE